MDFQAVSDAFRIHFYQWALSDAQRELTTNFQILRSIKGAMALRSLTLMETLSIHEQARLLHALVKRNVNRELLEAIEEPFTDEDDELCNMFRYHTTVMPITYTLEDNLYRQAFAGEISFKLNRSNFRRLINQKLELLFGKSFSKIGSEWGYRIEFDCWSIETWIELGGLEQLQYDHRIHFNNHYLATTDFLRWLGMGQTTWNFITEEDMALAVDALTILCSHFIAAVPRLLNEVSSKR